MIWAWNFNFICFEKFLVGGGGCWVYLRLRLDNMSACKSLSPLLELILCPRNLVFILINICVHLTCLQPQNLGTRLAGAVLSQSLAWYCNVCMSVTLVIYVWNLIINVFKSRTFQTSCNSLDSFYPIVKCDQSVSSWDFPAEDLFLLHR